MDPRSIYVNAADEPWRETPYVGVSFKKLLFELLWELPFFNQSGAHRHPAGEEYYVLEGSLEDGGRSWGEGSYVLHPPGSAHRPSSKDGCVVFISLPEPVEPLDEGECRKLSGK